MGILTFAAATEMLSHIQLFVTPWTVACQGPLSMEFFRQEYWSSLPFPPPGDFHSAMQPRSQIIYFKVESVF